MEFDLDKALEEVPIYEEDPPPPPPLDKKPTYFGELPTMEVQKLEHHTKLRPKPKKRTKPSRAPVRGFHLPPLSHSPSLSPSSTLLGLFLCPPTILYWVM